MEWYFIYPLLILTGFITGIINTLAGSGSLITLPVLMAFGLPPTVANGTNRIGILAQSLVSSASFSKSKVLDLKSSRHLLIPAIIGAIVGAVIAADFNEDLMRKTIGGLLLFMFFVLLWKPSKWLKERTDKPPVRDWVQVIVFFFIGIYGGFIQAGVGFFLLAGLVLGSGYELVKANALKVFITFAFTPIALIIFIINGQVDWVYGILLGIGGVAGAIVGARMAIKRGAGFIRIILLITILVASLKMLNVF